MIIRTIGKLLKVQGGVRNKIFNMNIYKMVRKEYYIQSGGYVLHPIAGQFSFNLHRFNNKLENRLFSNTNQSTSTLERELDSFEFDKISTETLESLTDYFDELIENSAHLKDADVAYRDGVLTVKFGDEYGTYVINRQTPNKQIWLSSPTSGPKRYDFIKGKWIYKHDGKSLHELLSNEIPKIVKSDVDFYKCSYSGAG